jgi:hypothetical protein
VENINLRGLLVFVPTKDLQKQHVRSAGRYRICRNVPLK